MLSISSIIDVNPVANRVSETVADTESAFNEVPENAPAGTPVGIIFSASDPKGGDVTYSLTNNAGGRFQIDARSGEVTVANGVLLDYETSRSHSITVRAQFGNRYSTARATIAVLNVNEFAPTIPTDINTKINRVAENVVAGATVGLTVRSIDRDGSRPKYHMIDDAGGRFVINSTTGVVTVSSNALLIDYESATSDHTITITASDGELNSSASFVIAVTNVAPSAFTDANPAANQVVENAVTGTFVGVTMSAFDPRGAPLFFTLSDDAGGRFQIDSASGQVSVANGALLDFEVATRHQIIATVTDGTAPPLSRTISIAVLNVNDPPTGVEDLLSSVAEDSGVRTISLASLLANDLKGPANESSQVLTITAVSNPIGGTVAIVGTNVEFTPSPNFNGLASFDYTVQDNGKTNGVNDYRSSIGQVSFAIIPVNDAPTLTLDSFTAVTREAVVGSFIANVNTTDVDLPLGDRVTTTLVGDAGGKVELVNGKIRTKRVLTLADVGTHTFTVTATDEQGLVTRGDFQIKVTLTIEEIRSQEVQAKRWLARQNVELLRASSPLDNPSWSTVGAPTGALGMITVPGDGNKYSISSDPTGRFLLATSQSNTVFLIDTINGATLSDRSFTGHTSLVTDAGFSHDGTLVATPSYDRNARIFDPNGNLLATIPLENLGLRVEFAPSDLLLAVSVHAKPGVLVDTQTFAIIGELPGTYAMDPRFAPDESAVVYTDDQLVRILDLKSNQVETIPVGIGNISVGDLSPDGDFYAVGSSTGMVAMINRRTSQVISKFRGDSSEVFTLSFSPHNELIVGHKSGRVAIYEASQPVNTGLPLLEEYQVGASARSIFVNPTGRTFGVMIYRDAPANSQIAIFPLPKAASGQATPVSGLGPSLATPADIATVTSEVSMLSQDKSDATGAEILAVRDMLSKIREQLDFSSKLVAPTSSEDVQSKIHFLSQQRAELYSRQIVVKSIQSQIDAIEASTFSVVTKGELVQVRYKLQSVVNRLSNERTELQRRSLKLAVTLERLNAALTSPPGTNISRMDAIDLSTAGNKIDRGNVVEIRHELLAAGGSISMQSVQGPTSTLTLDQHFAGDEPFVIGTGRFFAFDFAKAKSVVTAVTFVPTSTRTTDQLKVTFIRDGEKIGEQIAPSGSRVTFEDAAGITSVLIENAVLIMSDDARAWDTYRRNYVSAYSNSWQDPGKQFHFFNTVRNDLKAREGAIVNEANRGDVMQPLKLSRVFVTSNIAAPQSTVAPLSGASSREFSTLSAPIIDSQALPNNYWATPLFSYDFRQYNRVSLLRYGGSPVLDSIGYLSPSNDFHRLPSELYTILENGDWVIHPLPKHVHLAVVTSGGQPYRSDLKVGQNYDFEVVTKNGASLRHVLPESGKTIVPGDIQLLTVNQGGPAGWSSGNSLAYSTASPVAVGTLNVKARFTNPGIESVSFRVLVYSGHEGTAGWDSPVAAYLYSLGPSESRVLTTPVGMNNDSQGRGFVRFVVEDLEGYLLTESGRTVPSTRSVDVGHLAPDGSVAFKSLLYTTEETSRLVRIAQRGLFGCATGFVCRLRRAKMSRSIIDEFR